MIVEERPALVLVAVRADPLLVAKLRNVGVAGGPGPAEQLTCLDTGAGLGTDLGDDLAQVGVDGP